VKLSVNVLKVWLSSCRQKNSWQPGTHHFVPYFIGFEVCPSWLVQNKNSAMAEQIQETSPQVVNNNKRLGEMDVQDCSLSHRLIFLQEPEIDDQKDVLCWLSNEPASGSPAYKCLKCNFTVHTLMMTHLVGRAIFYAFQVPSSSFRQPFDLSATSSCEPKPDSF
jgi:hypothetical protein